MFPAWQWPVYGFPKLRVESIMAGHSPHQKWVVIARNS
jgi:hypothetical protein